MSMHFLNRFCKGYIAALALAPAVWPTVTMNGLFTNNMVLQHGMAVPVWGTASAGENISVSINGQTKTAIAGTSGAWKVVLDSLAIGGPFQMAIHGANAITLTNVMVGDVWLCSGQSNMTIGLGAFSYRDSLKTLTAGLGNVRLFSEKSDMHGIGPWYACSTSSIAGDFSATAFFFGKYLHDSLNIPIGLIVSAVGATFIEQWMPTQALIDDPELDTSTVMNGGNDGGLQSGLKAGGLYRGFIVPIQPFAIQGTIWYQGEWNTNPSLGSPNKYQTRFTELINGWRTEWGQGNFPFYFVQLPNFNSNDPWATIREAQRLTNKNVANTGMAIAIDLGNKVPGYPDSTELHPRDKRDVGYRLALIALDHAYKRTNPVASGPLFKSMFVRNDTAHLSFDYVGSGLTAKNGALKAFEIAAANDANFVAASANVASSGEVIVYKPGSKVTRVRYAWASNPVSTLYNREGLPASPFMSYVSDITEAQRKGPISADAARKGQTPGVVKIYDLTGRCIGQRCLSNFTKMPSAGSGAIPLAGSSRISKGVFIMQTISPGNAVVSRKIVME
jgi:sialate O-acetylesterase